MKKIARGRTLVLNLTNWLLIVRSPAQTQRWHIDLVVIVILVLKELFSNNR